MDAVQEGAMPLRQVSDGSRGIRPGQRESAAKARGREGRHEEDQFKSVRRDISPVDFDDTENSRASVLAGPPEA